MESFIKEEFVEMEPTSSSTSTPQSLRGKAVLQGTNKPIVFTKNDCIKILNDSAIDKFAYLKIEGFRKQTVTSSSQKDERNLPLKVNIYRIVN